MRQNALFGPFVIVIIVGFVAGIVIEPFIIVVDAASSLGSLGPNNVSVCQNTLFRPFVVVVSLVDLLAS